MTNTTIEQKAAFDFIRYASVWEDADVLCEGLGPFAQEGRLLSIASSGDNALAMLTLNPEEVVAVDMNPVQLACLDLRVAAFKTLSYEELLRFLGVLPSEDRFLVYETIHPLLSESSSRFWDRHPKYIVDGVIHCGKFEHYLRFFGTKILPWIHSKWKREELLKDHPLEQQKVFFDKYWNTWLWRLLFKVFFSRKVMGKAGRDPAFFDQVEGTVAERILSRTKHALTDIPTHTNPYLTYIITGNYRPHALPLYLRPEAHALIVERLDRITLIQGTTQDAPGKFDGFNLSDIFEYMNPTEFESCYDSLIEQANPDARLVYWNMLAPRSMPAKHEGRVKHLEEYSKGLHDRDKAWFYQAVRVDEVLA